MVSFLEFNLLSMIWPIQLLNYGGGMLFEGRTNHPLLLNIVSAVWGTIEIACIVLCGIALYAFTYSWWIAVPSTVGIYRIFVVGGSN